MDIVSHPASITSTTRIRYALPPLMLLLSNLTASGQSTGWQSLTESQGVDISFIVHRYGDGKNAGVVVKVANGNDVQATYRFRVIIRSDQRQWVSDVVEGALAPLEVVTGEMSGLWWIPFKDGAPVTEVGLRGLRIRIANQDGQRKGLDETS